MKNITGATLATITIEGQSQTLLVSHLSAALTSHSLALREWERKAIEKVMESISPYTLTQSATGISSPENALINARETIADINERHEMIKRIESLFKV
jgi:hypothetical protein